MHHSDYEPRPSTTRRTAHGRTGLVAALMLGTVLATTTSGCEGDGRALSGATGQSCMKCHNGSLHDDYAGPGLENPHPFPGADNLSCTTCHGGNPNGTGVEDSHVPPPPEIGDRENQRRNRQAYFNRLTLTGIDKVDAYTVDGRTYTGLDYLQFLNPGDLRVVTQSRSCGQCHASHAECVAGGLLATETGILDGAMYSFGTDNAVPANRGLYLDTAAGLGFRATGDPDHVPNPNDTGALGIIEEFPVFSAREPDGRPTLFKNDDYLAANLPADIAADGKVKTDSKLAHLMHEQTAFTCGDCHLGSKGANNRAGDYRSSGCTACHMPYSLSGRSGSRDPNIDQLEPRNPDDIDEPEQAHVRSHRIASVAKVLPSGLRQHGIDDMACAGCHQGSNRTVMQYWGIRLDQNQDVRRKTQYPADPVSFRNTARDTRLFDPEVGNRTFNGRNANQYLEFEDYDGDGRDDTPADVHHDAGMGCIDCHGSHDLHGGDVNTAGGDRISSRMEQAVAITCENCHGTVSDPAPVVAGTTYAGDPASVAVDRLGLPLRHVTKDGDGHYWLTSRLTGKRHYVRQTKDVVVNTGRTHPISGEPLYSVKASFAMGTDDGAAATGLGPHQDGVAPTGFTHTKDMSCASCHSSWVNSCIGCHLEGEYNTGNNFSNITGERIAFRERNADFVYQSPVMFQLGVGPKNKIEQVCPNTKAFFRYRDKNGDFSKTFSFTDRNGNGKNPSVPFPSLGHNAMMAHSIRGKVDQNNEGPRYCVACHLTDNSLATFGTQYDAFLTAMNANDFGALDFNLLEQHIGQNPGNQLDSPIWVHMASGLGSGLFLFDENGAPVNPLDDNAQRVGAGGVAPSTNFAAGRVALNLDRIVLPNGLATGSSNHALFQPRLGPDLRDGALQPGLAGPLGQRLLRRLTDPTNGIVLNAWIDADGTARGKAGTILGQ